MGDYKLGIRTCGWLHLRTGARRVDWLAFMTSPYWLWAFRRLANDVPAAAKRRRRPAPAQVRLPFKTPWEQWEQFAERAARERASDDAPPRAPRSQSRRDDDPWWYVGEPPGGGAGPPVR